MVNLTRAEHPVPGPLIKADGGEVMCPSLKLGRLKLMAADGSQDRLDDALKSGKVDAATWTMIGALVLTALKRNYPAITETDVDELVDLANLEEFIMALKGERKATGDPPTGEAGRPSAPSTSESSTG